MQGFWFLAWTLNHFKSKVTLAQQMHTVVAEANTFLGVLYGLGSVRAYDHVILKHINVFIPLLHLSS